MSSTDNISRAEQIAIHQYQAEWWNNKFKDYHARATQYGKNLDNSDRAISEMCRLQRDFYTEMGQKLQNIAGLKSNQHITIHPTL